MRWARGLGGGGASGAVAPFAAAGGVCGGAGGVGGAVVLWWAVLLLAFGFRLWFRSGLRLGNRVEVVEDVVHEMWAERCRAGLLLPGRWARPRGGRGASGSQVGGCSFGFGRGLEDEDGGEG